jgi:hypothetical protein
MIFHIIEKLAESPVWLGICGGSLIIPPIIGIMLIHRSSENN